MFQRSCFAPFNGTLLGPSKRPQINVSNTTDNCALNSDCNVGEYSDSYDPYSSAVGPSQHVTRASFDLLVGDNNKCYFAAEHTNPNLGQATLVSRSQFNLDVSPYR